MLAGFKKVLPGYEKPWEVLTQFEFVLGGKRQSFNTSRCLVSLTRLSVFRFHLFLGQNFGSYGGGLLTDCAWEGNKSSFPGSERAAARLLVATAEVQESCGDHGLGHC